MPGRLLRKRRTAIVAALVLGAAAAAAFTLVGTTAGRGKEAEGTGTRTFYVSPAGSDQNPGTRGRPWRTIQRALNRMLPGDATIVVAGTYPGDLTMRRDGEQGKRITLRGESGERPVIVGRIKITGDYVTVSGFVFRDGSAQRDVLVYVDGADHVRLLGNEIAGARQSGIFAGDGADDLRIIANWIHDNGTDDFLDHGIYYERGTGGMIIANLIEENAAYGVHLYPDANEITVDQNTIVRNRRAGVIVGGEETTSDDNVIVNNIIAFNGEPGIRTYWGGPTGAGNVAANNLVWENADGEVEAEVEGIEFTGTIEADPLFVDPDAGDYHLLPGSPAAGRAVPSPSVPVDLDGNPRSSSADLGAYEQ